MLQARTQAVAAALHAKAQQLTATATGAGNMWPASSSASLGIGFVWLLFKLGLLGHGFIYLGKREEPSRAAVGPLEFRLQAATQGTRTA